MNEVVINRCYGGFGLSGKAEEWLHEHGLDVQDYDSLSLPRHDSVLVECVKTLGKEANGRYAELEIVKIEGNKYRVCEYDGFEWIETPDSIRWETIE